MTVCELCGCEESHNFHHFIPRTLHSNKWFKKTFNRMQMSDGIDVCKQCHKTIHEMIPSEKELGKECHSLAALENHPKIAGYLKWKRRKQ